MGVMPSLDRPEVRSSVGMRPWQHVWLTAVALAAILILLLMPPHDLLDKADRYAYAVCHRLPAHSIFVAGRQLPLCARCSGTFLAALAGLIVLLILGRGRANRFPPPRFLLVLGLFMAAWAADGVNSYLAFFGSWPHLYEPHNLLRLATGALEGIVIATLVVPMFNLSFWSSATAQPVVQRWRDLIWLLVGAMVVVAAVASEWPALLYPLALASGLTVVLLVSVLCSVFVLIVMRRDGRLTGWREAVGPLLAGLALGLAGLTAIGLARDLLTALLYLPF